MNLGDLLPEDQSLSLGEKLLIPGCVIKAFVKDTNPPKIKYYIVPGKINEGILLASFYINSNLNGTIMRSPVLSDLQHLIRKDNYSFLSYDSYVDCSRLNQHNFSEVLNQVKRNPVIVVGQITSEDFSMMAEMMKRSPNISKIHLRELGFGS